VNLDPQGFKTTLLDGSESGPGTRDFGDGSGSGSEIGFNKNFKKCKTF
jgi:hypothetical protein